MSSAPKMRFYFAKLDFTSQVTSSSPSTGVGSETKTRQTLLEYGQGEDIVYREGESRWRFGTVDEFGGLVLGRFGKVFEDTPTTYDETEGDFVEEDLEEFAEASYFIADPALDVIIFNQRQRIGYNQFVRAFEAGYNDWADISGALSIDFITPTGELERIVEETTIHSVNFDLEPTNPSPTESMEELDERIQNMNADDVDLDADSEEGLNMQDELLQASLAFAKSPYGDVGLTYEENGETNEFTTKQTPASKEILRPDDLDDLYSKSNPLIRRAEELVG